MTERGALSLEEAEEAKRQALAAEEQLEKVFDLKQQREAAIMRNQMAARQEDKEHQLSNKQAAEKAEVRSLAQ